MTSVGLGGRRGVKRGVRPRRRDDKGRREGGEGGRGGGKVDNRGGISGGGVSKVGRQVFGSPDRACDVS
eukprot:3255231-Rhodomonas_salina.2